MKMNRRHFIHRSLLGAAGTAALVPKTWAKAAALWGENSASSASTIKYIREDIPAFEIPPYRGKTYEDLVPDTLDIAERARLGIHALTSIPDPTADYQIYWWVNLLRNPPVMQHQFSDYKVQVVEGFLEALPLLRTASGSDLNSHVDRAWMANFLKCLGPDGMFYWPLVGGPLERPNPSEGGDVTMKVWRADGTTTSAGDPSVTQMSSSQISARCLGTMSAYYLRDQNPVWKDASERMIQRLSALAIHKDDYCYFPNAFFEPHARFGDGAQMPLGLDAIEMIGRLPQGLSQCYRATGYEPALELAKPLVTYFRRHSETFDEQGRFIWTDSDRGSLGWGYNAKYEVVGGHAHGRAIGLLSMLEYATAAGDKETAQFVKSSFEWAKSQQASPFGVSTLVGWFPEWYYPEYPSCEGCMAADMVALAVELSSAGLGDYWDDVDRWVRNDFSEQQLTSSDWIYRATEHMPQQGVRAREVVEHTPERNIGAFAGWSSGNDWVVKAGIMHCCTGNGNRALYYVWQGILENNAGELRVNLLLNRASAWADIYSYVPYSGRVDLKIKASSKRVLVRAPEWVQSGSDVVACTVDGASRPLQWHGRYLALGAAAAGQTMTLTFPIPKRTVKERIGPEKYTVVVKGNTVISIDPAGKNGPLYADRGRYSGDDVQWRKLSRFVGDESIEW
jgi:hypothetical protein